MNREALEESIRTNCDIAFSRSSGPGGQHVNKVSTRVRLTISIDHLCGLSPEELERLLTYHKKFLISSKYLQVSVEDTRSQHRNREIAVSRMVSEIEKAAAIPKQRKPSSPNKAAKERRLKEKKQLRMKKILRSKVDPE